MRQSFQIRDALASRRLSCQARCCWKRALAVCIVLLSPLLLLPVVSCGDSASASAQRNNPARSSFHLESAAFKEGAFIPARFSCQGENVSPPLAWSGPPSGARSFALIVEDPDAPAGTWTHWVAYNLPAQSRAMAENTPEQGELANGGLQGTSSFGSVGYGGPCPPPGKAHRYFFRLYALDTLLDLKAGANSPDVLAAMQGHVMGEAQLMGRFKR
ncbi:MAG TPA: YbhB/YbcL family Raf kinase inhibitor-like protein [Terriglobia bacterium]|nr:YbhB/YbcL family Raf kinase inhibitor-like protein [Terriglobia bacterium]